MYVDYKRFEKNWMDEHDELLKYTKAIKKDLKQIITSASDPF